MRFRLLLILAIVSVLGAAGASLEVVGAETNARVAQEGAAKQKIAQLEATVRTLSASVTTTNRAFAGRVSALEAASLTSRGDTSTFSSDITDLADRVGAIEGVLGVGRLRYCRFGLIECVNGIALKVGP